jgi:hypothetical protein
MRQRRSRIVLVVPCAMLVVLFQGAASGCYSRVISAKGPASDQYQIQQPYQSNSKLDDWVFGTQQSPNNSRLNNLSSSPNNK